MSSSAVHSISGVLLPSGSYGWARTIFHGRCNRSTETTEEGAHATLSEAESSLFPKIATPNCPQCTRLSPSSSALVVQRGCKPTETLRDGRLCRSLSQCAPFPYCARLSVASQFSGKTQFIRSVRGDISWTILARLAFCWNVVGKRGRIYVTSNWIRFGSIHESRAKKERGRCVFEIITSLWWRISIQLTLWVEFWSTKKSYHK